MLIQLLKKQEPVCFFLLFSNAAVYKSWSKTICQIQDGVFSQEFFCIKMTVELSFAERCKQCSGCGTVALGGICCLQLWKAYSFMQVTLMQASWGKNG